MSSSSSIYREIRVGKKEKLVDVYHQLQQEYEQLHGPMTVVLCQVGMFYECYGYYPDLDPNPRTGALQVGKSRELAEILCMHHGNKSGSDPYGLSNPSMTGFPVCNYDMHKGTILQSNFTIVRIDQKKAGGSSPLTNNVEYRYVREIVSPATDIDTTSTLTGTNELVSIYIENVKASKHYFDYVLVCGMSSVDTVTGDVHVVEACSLEGNHLNALHEVYRFLLTHTPRELIIHLNKFPSTNDGYVSYLTKQLELTRYQIVKIKVNELPDDYGKTFYRKQLFTKVYPDATDLQINHLRYGCISFTTLLQYCYQHNEIVLKLLKVPQCHQVTHDQEYMELTFNAINQLHLLPMETKSSNKLHLIGSQRYQDNNTINSLLSVVDLTSTLIGKRYLRNMLLRPLCDPEKIDCLYNIIGELIEKKEVMETLSRHLDHYPDIEHLHRKVSLRAITPKELGTLLRSYTPFAEICNLLITQALDTTLYQEVFGRLLMEGDLTQFNDLINYINQTILIDPLISSVIDPTTECMTTTTPYLRLGVDEQYDQLWHLHLHANEKLDEIHRHLNSFFPSAPKGTNKKGTLPVEMMKNKTKGKGKAKSKKEEELCYFQTTTSRATSLRLGGKVDTNLCGTLEFVNLKSKTMIISDTIRKLFADHEVAKNNLEQYSYKKYQEVVAHLATYSCYTAMAHTIGFLDYVRNNAKVAIKYRYYRPTIEPTLPDYSYLEMKELRHPIIERLLPNEYITNDVEIGRTPRGMLVYGVNACGKSSLAKAIALNIIMAQAGMYVPSKLTYTPYTQLITRLSSHDDIFKGLSSFDIELSELKPIINQANYNTLVIGDELTRGTEINSGAGITIATIENLVKAGVSFVFSTHLHHLPASPYLTALTDSGKLRVCHLSNSYQEGTDELIYDRKLQEGSGTSAYGIEVAKFMKFSDDFINRANEIRRYFQHLEAIVPPEVSDELVSTKKSRYNSNVYMDECSLCGRKGDLHTHHIREQKEADEEGWIDHYHKNREFNLLVLCRSCHQTLHANKQKIVPQVGLHKTTYTLVDE